MRRDTRLPWNPARWPLPGRLVFGAALALLALVVRLALERQLYGFPFLTYYPAGLLAAFFGGLAA
ncbi:MAG: hypothetical protein ACJ8GO_02330, partial [Ramlibacter sp.]